MAYAEFTKEPEEEYTDFNWIFFLEFNRLESYR